MNRLRNFIANTYTFGDVYYLTWSVLCALLALAAPWYIELPLIFFSVYYYNRAMM